MHYRHIVDLLTYWPKYLLLLTLTVPQVIHSGALTLGLIIPSWTSYLAQDHLMEYKLDLLLTFFVFIRGIWRLTTTQYNSATNLYVQQTLWKGFSIKGNQDTRSTGFGQFLPNYFLLYVVHHRRHVWLQRINSQSSLCHRRLWIQLGNAEPPKNFSPSLWTKLQTWTSTPRCTKPTFWYVPQKWEPCHFWLFNCVVMR